MYSLGLAWYCAAQMALGGFTPKLCSGASLGKRPRDKRSDTHPLVPPLASLCHRGLGDVGRGDCV